MYSMSCAPLTCCSMDAATDSETTLAWAPGKVAFPVPWGGTTCGYCAIGRPNAASAPDRIMSSAMTVESTGRSMKKLSIAAYFADLLAETNATGRTGAPGRSLPMPSTTTRSPAARPLATTHSLPRRWLVMICPDSTLWPFPAPVLADGEVHPHRGARVQRGEHGLLRRDQRAGLHLRARHEAVARRAHRGELEVQLGVAQQRPLRLDQRATGALLRHRGVVVLLTDRLLGDQAPIARQVLPGIDEIRLGLRKAGLRLAGLRFERPRGDQIEQLALLHPRAIGERLALEQPGDLRADLDRVRRLRLRHVLVVDRDRSVRHCDHRDFGR